MCGIVGYIGQNDAYPVLIEGLKKLECKRPKTDLVI